MALRYPLQNWPEAEKCMAEMIAYWEKDPASKDKEKSIKAHQSYGQWLEELGKHDRP